MDNQSSLGSFLRGERERKGIRLEEIASITKIHIHSLELLEANELDRLPPEPFIRGFIIAYAKYVGIDTKDAISKYLGHRKPAEKAPEQVESAVVAAPAVQANPQAVLSQPWLFQGRRIFLIGFGIGVFLLTFAIIFIGKKAAEEPDMVATTAPPPPAKPAEPAKTAVVQNETAKPVSPTEQSKTGDPRGPAAATPERQMQSKFPPMPEGTKHQLHVISKEKSWMKLVVDDELPVQKHLNENAVITFHARDKIKLVLGNSTDAEVFHNGEKVEGKVFQGTVKYYIFPKGSRFPQDPVKKPKPEEQAEEQTEAAPEKPSE